MTTSHIYHTQGIRNFHYYKETYSGNTVNIFIKRNPNKFECSVCRSKNVLAIHDGNRKIKGLKSGTKQTFFIVKMHRLRCLACGSYRHENLGFIPRPKVHYTRALERSIIELRSEMTIKALANYFGLHWGTVKDIEKYHLGKKYKRIRLKDVEYIGIDEVYVGYKKYLTIVRDMITGAVLYIGKGKGGDSLEKLAKKLKHSKCKIKAAAVDLAPSYSAWLRKNLPNTDIVYDHFHLIKLMNEKINQIRRKTMSELDEHLKEKLKGERWLFVRNIENLDKDEKERLDELKIMFDDLGTACFLKEALRKIYAIAEYDYDAELALNYWCKLAKESKIPSMKTMSKTILRNMDGIKGYWKHNSLTSAGMEGFNNKIGWLNRQAYGYRDEAYFLLKIFDLPTINTVKAI